MKRMIRALKAKLSRPKVLTVADRPRSTVSVEGVSMPDVYADKSDATTVELEILPPLSADESIGFDPYDTAKMHKKKRSATTRS